MHGLEITFGSIFSVFKILQIRGDNGNTFSITDWIARVFALISMGN